MTSPWRTPCRRAALPIISNGAWRFGNDICCGNRFFDGGIDDVLSAEDVGLHGLDRVGGVGAAQLPVVHALLREQALQGADPVGHAVRDVGRHDVRDPGSLRQ